MSCAEYFPALDDGTLLGVNAEPSILVGRLLVQYAIRQKLGMPTPLIKQDPNLNIRWSSSRPVSYQGELQVYPWEQTDVPPADWSIEAFQ